MIADNVGVLMLRKQLHDLGLLDEILGNDMEHVVFLENVIMADAWPFDVEMRMCECCVWGLGKSNRVVGGSCWEKYVRRV